MKTVLVVASLLLVSMSVSAQRTTEPVNLRSNQIIVVFPDTLSAAQIYRLLGVALVQNGFNIDSREQSFGLLLANMRDPAEGILSRRKDFLELRIAVINNEVFITGDFVRAEYTDKLVYTTGAGPGRSRWEKVMKVLSTLPGIQVEYAAANQKAAYN